MKRLRELREESVGQTRMLWHSNYWDGPMSGLMLWNGEKAWFNMKSEENIKSNMSDEDWNDYVLYYKEHYNEEPDEEDRIEYDRIRVFNVHRLPKNIMEAVEHNHELFRKYVGTHTDYDMNGNRGRGATSSKDLGDLRPYNQHSKFYNAKTNKGILVKLFPFLFKKKDLRMSYNWKIENYEIIGQFEE